jgi:ketosteroid isomerase-like protein
VAARHVDVVERMFGLSNRCAGGDLDALDELTSAYHDDAEINGWLTDSPVSDERGGEAVRAYFDRVLGVYEKWQCVLDYVQDYGERVLALGALRAVQAGGAESEQAVGWIITFRDEKVASVKAYPSYGDALRAVTARSHSPSR